MRGAAAALAGAVLFFLGVLTAASDGGRVSPPPAIPLGIEPAASAADRAPTTGADGTPAVPAPPVEGEPAPSDGEPAGTPAGEPASGPPDPSSVPPAGEEPPAADGSGGVEEVGGRVDCVEVGGATGGRAGTAPGRGDQDNGACPPGQADRAADPPQDKKGDGDGQP